MSIGSTIWKKSVADRYETEEEAKKEWGGWPVTSAGHKDR